MIAHTNAFKQEIAKMGRQIKAQVVFERPSTIIAENAKNIITEDNNQLTTERMQRFDNIVNVVHEKDIYSINIIKNGDLLQSLMKQCNIEIKEDNLTFNINIGDRFYIIFYLLVNGNYETLIYRNFIIHSKSYNAENETWQYVAYDEMLLTMKKYARLNVSYPITVKEYIKAITDKLGLGFGSNDIQFVNYDKLIYKDYFVGKDVTYRDILDKLSEITASNILMKEGNLLYVAYPTETSDVIDETYLKAVNVNFNEKFGPVNKIEAIDKENNLSYIVKNDTSIKANGETKITITNNPFIFNGEENEICQNILNQLANTSYYINDFTTTGVCYYEFLDKFTVSINNANYNCLLLNNEINITQGIEETIFTEKPKNTKTETNNFQNDSMSNKEIQTNLEQLNDEKVSKNNIVNSLNQSPEGNIIKTSKIFIIKQITGTTDSSGFLDVSLNGNYILCHAIGTVNAFYIPYYDNSNSIWKLKIENASKTAIANTQVTITMYYIRKEG